MNFPDLKFLQFGIKDMFDILIVTILIYQVYRLLSRTRAIPVLIGLTLIFVLSIISRFFALHTVGWLFDVLSNFLIIAMIVALQPELRRLFYNLGQIGWIRSLVSVNQLPVDDILSAVTQMGEDKTGALLVIVNKIGLRQLVEGGIVLQAKISRELLMSIFFEKNPLHDGAVIIQGGNIVSAACYLPLSSSDQLKRTHGARHRAGLGISEESDALSIIVSEEKGWISVAFMGELREKLDGQALKNLLYAFNANRLEDEWENLFQVYKGGKK